MAGITLSEDQLDAAVKAGVLSAEQIRDLWALSDDGDRRHDADDLPADRDDERFQLFKGFNDIFLSIGIALIALAIFAMGNLLVTSVIVAATVVGLSDYLVVRKKTVLPGIVLASIFSIAWATFGVQLLDWSGFGNALTGPPFIINQAIGYGWATVAAAVFYVRYRLPFALLIVGLGSGLTLAFAGLYATAPTSPLVRLNLTAPSTMLPSFLVGVVVFLAGMRFDISDPGRKTRRADCAFWLHMAAAPLLVHPLVSPILFSLRSAECGGLQALFVLVLIGVVGLIALAIDRRAMLVASLFYLISAIGYLLKTSTGATTLHGTLAVSLFVVGILVLILGLGWHGLRRTLLGLMPDGPLKRILPPPPPTA